MKTPTDTGFSQQATAEVIPISDPVQPDQSGQGAEAADSADYSKKWDEFPHSVLVRSTRHYKVYLDLDGKLDWVSCHEFDLEREQRSASQRKAEGKILGRIALAQCAPSEHLDNEIQKRFFMLLGEAHVSAFECEYDTANSLVDDAVSFLRERKEELSRSWYLRAAIRAGAISLVLGFCVWLARDPLAVYLGREGVDLIAFAAAGSLGALLSVIARSGKLRFDPSSGRALHDLEAASRICAGGISAVLAVLALRSGLVLGPLASAGGTGHVLLFAAIAAGGAERFGSSIIARFDTAGTGLNGSHQSLNKKENE